MDPLATALAGGNGGYEGHLAAASLLKGGPHAASSKLAQDAALVETAIALVANRTHHHRRWCVDDGHCRFPQRCLVEGPYRRYCVFGLADIEHGRTLFDRDGVRSPAAHACERCDAPLALLDFGSTPGSYNCSTVCESSVGAAHEVHDGASFEASNCETSCHFLEMELYGGAVLTTSPYFPGTEPSDALHAALADAAAVADAERFAWDRVAETRAAVGAAGEQVERRAARLAALLAASARADAAVADALYIEARAARDLEEYERGGQVRNYRSARGALEKATADRIASEEFAAATLADYEAAAAPPFAPSVEVFAPEAEAAAAVVSLATARNATAAAAAAAEVAGLQLVPLPPSLAAGWGTDLWGRAAVAKPSATMLRLTEAKSRAYGWAVLRPGRELTGFRVELDLLIAGGTGGDGFAVSYGAAPPSALVEEWRVEDPRFSLANTLNTAYEDEFPPPASADGGLGASVTRTQLPPTPGNGVSFALRTQPYHAAQVWLNGALLAERVYHGCPPEGGTFGASCVACLECPQCEECTACNPQAQCPLRSVAERRRFARLVVTVSGGGAGRPPRLEATRDGLAFFDAPVELPGLSCPDGKCGVALSAACGRRGKGPDPLGMPHDDEHWVDNVRVAAQPAKPAPPLLVNATTEALTLSWVPPHHGGEPIDLYRLRLLRASHGKWMTVFVGNATTHTVHRLTTATAYLFRVEAHNALGWGHRSSAATFATAAPLFSSDSKPPLAPRVNGASAACGGRLYVVGGQPQGSGRHPGGETLASLEEFSWSSRTWVRRADMHVARSHLALACYGDARLVAIGGYGTLGHPPFAYEGFHDTVEEYDAATDTWTMRPSAPTARYYHAATHTPDGLVYAAGGYGTVLGSTAAALGNESLLSAFEKLDPRTGVWSRKAPMPAAVYGLALGAFDCARRCRILAAGGHDVNGFTDRVYLYDSRVDAWEVRERPLLASIHTARNSIHTPRNSSLHRCASGCRGRASSPPSSRDRTRASPTSPAATS